MTMVMPMVITMVMPMTMAMNMVMAMVKTMLMTMVETIVMTIGMTMVMTMRDHDRRLEPTQFLNIAEVLMDFDGSKLRKLQSTFSIQPDGIVEMSLVARRKGMVLCDLSWIPVLFF